MWALHRFYMYMVDQAEVIHQVDVLNEDIKIDNHKDIKKNNPY